MGSGARFWRNVAIIGGAHVLLVIAFVRWSGATKSERQQPQITWLSGAAIPTSTAADLSARTSRPPPPQDRETPEPEQQPTIAPAKSQIQLPTPTPLPTATPRPVPKLAPTALPKPSAPPKPTQRATPNKSVIAKATPKPKPKPRTTPTESDEPDFDAIGDVVAKITGATGGGGSARSGGTAKTETQWYGRMLHDRFHNAWDQPTSVVAAGTKMSALVKARIERDGRVSRFDIVKPSGNVVVDDSVRAVASKVTQVDPLPSGVGNGEHYDVTINFELNPED